MRLHPRSFAIASLFLAASAANSQDQYVEAAPSPAPEVKSYSGSLLERSTLTGDWGGFRDELAASGWSFNADLTQYYFGVVDGGRGDTRFRYGGHLNYYGKFDGLKVGGALKGTSLIVHGETAYGQSVNQVDGAFLQPTIGTVFPGSGQTALTGVKLIQALSENFVLFGGKLNTLDDFIVPFAGVRGETGFANAAFAFNPLAIRQLPYSTYGAGAAVIANGAPVATVAVYDAVDSVLRTGLENLFDRGAVVVGDVNLPVKPMGLLGHQGFTAIYSTRTYLSFDPNPYLNLVVPGQSTLFQLRSPSWSLTYHFDQTLWQSACNPEQNFGVFGQLGIADSTPSPIRHFASIGVSGSSPLGGRAQDRIGVGYYYLGVSDNVKDTLGRVLPLRDEYGVEVFYDVAVTPWFHVTPDFQVTRPTTVAADTALIAGVRARINF